MPNDTIDENHASTSLRIDLRYPKRAGLGGFKSWAWAFFIGVRSYRVLGVGVFCFLHLILEFITFAFHIDFTQRPQRGKSVSRRGRQWTRFIACDARTCASTHFPRSAIPCYSLGRCPRCDGRIVFGARSWCSFFHFFFTVALLNSHDAETLED